LQNEAEICIENRIGSARIFKHHLISILALPQKSLLV